MAARPTVSVYGTDGFATGATSAMPKVFTAPIRQDIVVFVHTNMRKNKRQAYSVNVGAGHQTSAESWGTGRAVSRIPRVCGGGTSRSGQAAFGNMCRGGRMFAPTKVWRRWHKKINKNQRRYAVASALAASAVPALVMARGHKVDQVPELPLVISGGEKLSKTAAAYKMLQALGAGADVDKCKASKKVRRGKGKMRNRRYEMRRGPLVVYDTETTLVRSVRNLPGVDTCQVDRLNLLQLAPGGHLGRFVVWTQSAFDKLNTVFSDACKKGYTLPTNVVSNGDIGRIINSDAIQSVVRTAIKQKKLHCRKKNPLTNLGAMVKLNPYALTMRRTEITAQKKRAEKKAGALAKARGTKVTGTQGVKARRVASKKFLAAMLEDDFSESSEEESSSEEEEDEEDEEE